MIRHNPYPHFILNDFFDPISFEELKQCLNSLKWEEAKSQEYLKDNSTKESTTLVITNFNSSIFSYLTSNRWLKVLGNYFNVEIKECSTIVFLRMNKGFFNFVHSDANSYGELVRLILYISESDEYSGGELVIHNSDKLKSIYSEMKFESNTLFGFKMSESSYHSVKEIKTGCRICLSLTYS